MSSAAREVEYCCSHVPPMIEPTNDSKVTHSRVDRVAQQLNGRISSNQSSLSSGEALGFGGGVCGAISRRLARDEGADRYIKMFLIFTTIAISSLLCPPSLPDDIYPDI